MKTNTYAVTITTGDVALGGTDSNVFIQFTGTNGRTDSIYLPPRDVFSFEAGSVDRFVLEVPDVGDLTRCCVGHDGAVDSGWYVVDVLIQDDETTREWHFRFDQWLGQEEAGRQFACVDL
ncbi:MAG: PLAT/LH2 domain-containing protein [bacterium]|nr:PLAT/LH2 domain-containing protein [bacterium]